MRIKLSEELIDELKKLKSKDQKLYNKIQKQLEIFIQNPGYPSLRLHKLTGNIDNRWSISITMSIRMVYVQQEANLAYFIALGTHDQVYDNG